MSKKIINKVGSSWEGLSFEQVKRKCIEQGSAFLLMFGDKPICPYNDLEHAKSMARMYRDHDGIPDVRIKYFK